MSCNYPDFVHYFKGLARLEEEIKKNLEELGTYTDSLGNSYVVHCGEH